ncbi:MAG: IS1595 family transposase [Dehalococcoidia bacterium]|nr:IS1595 family transposase [Dehalococcoidia bacterium]MYD28613.1 IS1595 family transposase [Dehalococcoidia bacterium]
MPRKKGPGRAHRDGLSAKQFRDMFPDDEAAELFFEKQRWPEGRFCPDCGSKNTVLAKQRSMPYFCNACRSFFSVRKGTVMQSSKLGYWMWLYAAYQMMTNIKGISSMKLHRDLDISQKAAWHMLHRLREAFEDGSGELLPGPVEVDETFIGGKFANKPKKVRAAKYSGMGGRGPLDDKEMVVGIVSRRTGEVRAEAVGKAKGEALRDVVHRNVRPGAHVFTDQLGDYKPLGYQGFRHASVNHNRGEYVAPDGYTHTQSVESFWSLLKRGYNGTFHHFSAKHTQRYVTEFAKRQSIREMGTLEQMKWLARAMVGKRLRYADLTA